MVVVKFLIAIVVGIACGLGAYHGTVALTGSKDLALLLDFIAAFLGYTVTLSLLDPFGY